MWTPPGSGTMPLVGRDQDLRYLAEALNQAVSRRGQVVLVTGEPGIGKTRVCDELAATASDSGSRVILGRAYEWSGAPAYWPWRQALQVALEDPELAAFVEQVGPVIAPLASVHQLEHEFIAGSEPAHDRFHVFEAAAALLKRIAHRRPLVVILDDLHWADTSTLLLFEYLTPVIRDDPILLIGTYREGEAIRGTPLSRMLGSLTREMNTGRLALRRLSRSDVVQFVAAATGELAENDLVGKVYDSSDGNPLFMTEIVRMLTADFGAGWATHTQAAAVRLPETIRDMILMRLDRLPNTTNEVLAAASVLGREFNVGMLDPVTGLGGETCLVALDPAIRASIIEPAAMPGAFRFGHVLLQEAVYDEISPAERARLHLRVAEAFESRSAEGRLDVAEIAYHAYRALPVGDAEKAVQYAIAAGDQAVQQVAWESAVEQYDRALSLLDNHPAPDGSLRCDVLLSLGLAQWQSGHPEAARDRFQAAYGIAKGLHSPERQAQAVLGFAGSGIVGVALRDSMLITLIEETLDDLGPGDSLLRVRLLCQLLYFTVGDSDSVQRRRDYAEEVLAMGRRLHDDSALLQALDAAWYACLGPDMLHERMAIAEEQLRVGERTGDTHAVLMANGGKADDALLVGDLTAYAHHIEMYRRFSGELRLPVHMLGAAHMRAGLVAVQGRLDEARRQIERIPNDQIEALPNGAGRRMLTLPLVVICREQERLAEILNRIDEIPAGIVVGSELHCRLERVCVYLELGDDRPADEALEELTPDAIARLARDGFWLPTLVRAAEISIELNDLARAELLYELLRDYPDLNAVASLHWVCYGSVSHWLGLLAAALGRFDAAQHHFEQALAMHERMGAQLFSTQTRVAYAEMLLHRNRSGDPSYALDLANRALATAGELGLVRLRRLAQGILDSVGRSPTSSTHGLSPRELEVLRLIVEGQSDREIGEALSISHRTVMRHVTHILDKLGVNSRTAAAAVAIRRGIL